jgi:GNAT superfamily N-acetyltransferase
MGASGLGENMATDAPYMIREGYLEDRPAARELTIAAYGEYAVIMAPSAWEPLHRAILAALDFQGSATHLVAEQDGVLIGSVLLFPASGADTASSGGRMVWPELRLLAVAPAARAQGVGAALVAACIERARAAGAPALGLYTSDSMRTAMALYERLGFTRVPEYDFQPPGAELVKAYRLLLAQ